MEETGAALARLFLNTSFLHLPFAAARRRAVYLSSVSPSFNGVAMKMPSAIEEN